VRTLAGGLDHPEGVAYDPDAHVVWAGGEAGQLYRVDPDTGTWEEQAARAPGFVLGLAVDGRGRLALCASHDGSLCAYDGETVTRVLTGRVQPNFPAFGPDGTLYLSDSGTWSQDDGCVVRLSADGEAAILSRDVPSFTNGLAVSPDGRWLWVVESYEPRLSRIDLQGDGRAELVRRFDGTVLDGLALTADGGMLVSCYRPDRIYHLDRDGHAEVLAEDPQGTLLAAPTNVCFTGPELDVVVAANLGRWHLTRIETELRGVPPHRPRTWALDA
jgi:gluconolactonase